MQRLLSAIVTGLKAAMLAQSPVLAFALILGLARGTGGIEPGFEAVGRLLWCYSAIFGPPLALLGFVCGAVPGGSANN
jgi:hypothetical protein